MAPIKLFTSAHHLSLTSTRLFHPMPPLTTPYFLKIPLITLQSRPRSSNWSPSLKFPHQNSVCPPPCPHHATRLAPLTFLDLTTLVKSIYHEAPHCVISSSPITSSLLCPHIFLSAIFSNTLNIYSFLYVRDQVSHPQKITKYWLRFNLCISRWQTGRQKILNWLVAGRNVHILNPNSWQ